MRHAPSGRGDLDAVAMLMADFRYPWFFCGGSEIELFLGQPLRSHKDVDVAIFRCDQLEIQIYLAARGWELATAEDGVLDRWEKGKWLDLPFATIWCRNPAYTPHFLE